MLSTNRKRNHDLKNPDAILSAAGMLDSMWREMSKIFKELRFDSSVRVIVLASESEKIWTAGLDGTR